MEIHPTWASYYGEQGHNDQWDQITPAQLKKQQEKYRTFLKDLENINRSRLEAEDKISLDLSIKNLKSSIQEIELGLTYLSMDHRWGVQNLNETSESLSLETLKDYNDWLTRMETLPQHIDEIISLQKEGLSKKIAHPMVIVKRIQEQLAASAKLSGKKSPYWKAFKEFPKKISASEQKTLQERALRAINEKITPAIKKYEKFINTEYNQVAPKGVGLWQLPGGDKIYSFLAAKFTTTNMTPEEIHQLGLKEVTRIRSEMEKVKKQVKFKGSLKAFFTFMRTNKKFFFKTSDELLNAYRAISKKADPKLVKLFGKLPRMPYGVVPIPKESAPHTTTAYYMGPAADGTRPGNYYVNLYKPETRPSWEMAALSLHEAVPGHHLQIALAQELGELPKFRRMDGATAYIEGWGLYAEFLGEEMEMYENPYDKFGQLTYEMWRAVRLVVDTGIHYKKWPRQKAIDYFMANTPKTKHDITNEIDRYIGNPGQALAYKIGQLKLIELRRKAEKKLGKKFDVRAFHDEILSHGALPLDVLETAFNEWLSKQS